MWNLNRISWNTWAGRLGEASRVVLGALSKGGAATWTFLSAERGKPKPPTRPWQAPKAMALPEVGVHRTAKMPVLGCVAPAPLDPKIHFEEMEQAHAETLRFFAELESRKRQELPEEDPGLPGPVEIFRKSEPLPLRMDPAEYPSLRKEGHVLAISPVEEVPAPVEPRAASTPAEGLEVMPLGEVPGLARRNSGVQIARPDPFWVMGRRTFEDLVPMSTEVEADFQNAPPEPEDPSQGAEGLSVAVEAPVDPASDPRGTWGFSLAVRSKKPIPPRGPEARLLTREEWVREGVRLFGPNKLDWIFRCPACGQLQSCSDFMRHKVDFQGRVFQNCLSIYLHSVQDSGRRPCRFRLVRPRSVPTLYVQYRDMEVPVFEFYDPKAPAFKVREGGATTSLDLQSALDLQPEDQGEKKAPPSLPLPQDVSVFPEWEEIMRAFEKEQPCALLGVQDRAPSAEDPLASPRRP